MKTKIEIGKIICVIGISIFLSSCHKEKIEEPIKPGVPVFMVSGQLANDTFYAAAGQNGYELTAYTDYMNGVTIHSGKMIGPNYEIYLKLMDGIIDIPGIKFQDHIPNEFDYFIPESEELLEISKEQFDSNGLIDHIDWYVDGVFSGSDDLQLDEPGVYNVCAFVEFNDGSNISSCNKMFVGFETTAKSALRHHIDEQGVMHSWVETYGIGVQSIKWFVDGQEKGNETVLTELLTEELHTITAEIMFTNGAIRSKSIIADGADLGRTLDDFSVYESAQSDIYSDFDLIFEIKKNGSLYSTQLASNQLSEFEILDMSYFGKNEAGMAVYKLTAYLNCKLKNALGDMISFTGDITFGITGE
jgi:hypothetical protein